MYFGLFWANITLFLLFFIYLFFFQHSSHQQGQSGNRSFVLRGINCFSNNDRYQSSVTLPLKPNTRQNIFIDINSINQIEAKVVSNFCAYEKNSGHDTKFILCIENVSHQNNY